ncbi:hypothetical protein [Salegentibacter sp. F14]
MKEIYRNISIVFEIERSVKFLIIGLGEIQKITSINDFYDPILIYLSNGLERLFKTMLCLSFKENHNRLPNLNEVWNNKNGHDLLFLKNEVEKICIEYSQFSWDKDYEIIRNDKLINSVCETLSEYGKRSRYFDLDAILGKKQEFNATKAWNKIETQLSIDKYGEDEYYRILGDPRNLEKIYSDLNKELIIRLELFFRALTRQFTLGNFSKDSKIYYFQIKDFLDIRDSELGKTDYRNLIIK